MVSTLARCSNFCREKVGEVVTFVKAKSRFSKSGYSEEFLIHVILLYFCMDIKDLIFALAKGNLGAKLKYKMVVARLKTA